MTVKSTKSPTIIKSFLELVKSYWGYFMTLVAIITFIWTVGVKSERKSNENNSVKKDIIELKQEVKKIDSVLVIVSDIRETQDVIIEKQNAQRDSWIKYLVNKKDLTNKDFLEYMEGLEFRIMPQKSEASLPDTTSKYDSKIVIKKIK